MKLAGENDGEEDADQDGEESRAQSAFSGVSQHGAARSDVQIE
jgi:hypothetical protein